MNDHLPRRRGGGALFGGSAGDKGCAFHQVVQPVIGAGDDAFGEKQQRTFSCR